MQSERGEAIVIAVVILGVAIFGIAGYLFFKGSDKQAAENTQSVSEGPQGEHIYTAMPIANPPAVRTLQSIDSFLSKDDSGVYLKKKSASAGETTTAFLLLDVPDPASLVRVYPPTIAQQSSANTGATPSTSQNASAYYADQEYVYVLEASSPSGSPSQNTNSGSQSTEDTTYTLTEVIGPDPATFQLLGDQYAKDANNVYHIVTTCDEDGTCTQTFEVLSEADAQTFQEYETSLVEQANGGASVVSDAADINNVYYNGEVVGSAAGDVVENRKVYGTQEPNGLIWIP